MKWEWMAYLESGEHGCTVPEVRDRHLVAGQRAGLVRREKSELRRGQNGVRVRGELHVRSRGFLRLGGP